MTATFALALLAAPPARPEPLQMPGCDRNLADATANVAAMQAQIKKLGASAGPQACTATRLYFLEVVVVKAHFLEVVKARAVTALCKSGTSENAISVVSMPMLRTLMRHCSALPLTENEPSCSTAPPKFHGIDATNARVEHRALETGAPFPGEIFECG